MSALSQASGFELQHLQHALDAVDFGLLWVDAEGRIVHANRCFLLLNAAALTLADCFPGLELPQWQALLRQARPAPQLMPLQLRRGDGGQSPLMELELPAAPLRPGSADLAVLLLRPLDERSERESIASLQHEVLEAVVLGRPLPVVMDLLCRRVEALAPEVICSVLAIDEQARLRPLAAPSLPAHYSAALDGLAIGPTVGSCGTAAWRQQAVQVRDIAQDPLWQDYRALALQAGLGACWSTPIFLAPQRVGATFALYYREPREVAPFHRRMVEACEQLCTVALKSHEHLQQIERLAYFDGVTGLANRSLFGDRVTQALQIASRSGGGTAALLLLDLDRFKTVNDSHGHATGDEVLRQVAQRLSHCLREADTLARLGGDEFVAWLPGCSAARAMQVAEKLLKSLQQPVQLSGHPPLQISASIGISCYPEDGHQMEQLFKDADIAMYEAKRAGRNCARFFLPAMNRALDERLSLETALRQAMSRQLLSLHYQAKVSLVDDSLVGVEALLRWWDPDRGQVPPDQFIPVAEDCGLVNALDAWVLETACAQLAQWREQGVAIRAVAVNVSPTRFQQDDVAAHVQALLLRHALRPEQLTLEMTERLVLEQDARTAGQLAQLHAMGVRLSVDDFGTGYSSLGYLKRLPVSELKLDRSFVRDLETDAGDRALASAVIGIGRALDLGVVAEGVETEGQRRILIELGCSVAQGYCFARPLPAAAMADWLRMR